MVQSVYYYDLLLGDVVHLDFMGQIVFFWGVNCHIWFVVVEVVVDYDLDNSTKTYN